MEAKLLIILAVIMVRVRGVKKIDYINLETRTRSIIVMKEATN